MRVGGTGSVTLEWVARLDVTSPVTSADLTSDGKQLALVAKAGAYLFTVDGDLKRAGQEKPKRVKFKKGQIEGCCFVSGMWRMVPFMSRLLGVISG